MTVVLRGGGRRKTVAVTLNGLMWRHQWMMPRVAAAALRLSRAPLLGPLVTRAIFRPNMTCRDIPLLAPALSFSGGISRELLESLKKRSPAVSQSQGKIPAEEAEQGMIAALARAARRRFYKLIATIVIGWKKEGLLTNAPEAVVKRQLEQLLGAESLETSAVAVLLSLPQLSQVDTKQYLERILAERGQPAYAAVLGAINPLEVPEWHNNL